MEQRSVTTCLTDDRVAALLEGNLSADDRSAAERHLAACVPCRRLVSELLKIERPSELQIATEPALGAMASPGRTVATATLSPGDALGRYIIQRQIGVGGMGIVYAAYDPELDRQVALKLLRPDVAETVADAHERVRREARAMARVQHPSIVQVHDVGVDGDRVYITMEYIQGEDLAVFAARQRERGDWRSIVAACVDAARGLAAAHAAGLVHRDFKPSNVLRARDGRVVVVDLGLTRPVSAVAAGATRWAATPPGHSIAAGTPGYVAPEQAAGLASDARSDQYSFCLSMRECLFGGPPGLAGAPDAAPAGPVVPAAIRAALARGSREAPEERFAAMTDLVDAILEGLPKPGRARVRLGLAATMLAGAVVAAVLVRGDASAPAATPAAAPIGVLVQSLDNQGSPYGASDNRGGALADVLALVLRDYRALAPTGPQAVFDTQWRAFRDVGGNAAERVARADQLWADAARRLGVRYRITGSYAERGDAITIKLRVIDVATARVVHEIDRTRPVGETAELVRELASSVAQALQPGAHADPVFAADARARELMARGAAHVAQRNWLIARPYFEQAAEVAPALYDAWRALVPIDAWTLAPEPVLVHAIERAAALAPDAASKQLWDGAGAFLRGDLAHAIATLSALERAGGPGSDRSELDYYLGDALFHDGRYAEGVQRLARVLEIPDAGQRAGAETAVWPVAVHLGEYALARRDLATASQYLLLQKQSLGPVRFARGDYAALAASDDPPFSGYAALLLGRTPAAADQRSLMCEPGYEIARAAGAGDLAAARRELARWWSAARAQPPSVHASYDLARVLDIALAAGLGDEARAILVEARPRVEGVGGLLALQHADILIAAELGTPKTFARTGLTTRSTRLATAIEAALAGDRERGAKLLGELVDDPGPQWDYPERVVLVRLLHDLGRTRELRARCAELDRPAVFGLALLPARATCRRLLGAPAS